MELSLSTEGKNEKVSDWELGDRVRLRAVATEFCAKETEASLVVCYVLA